jgi:hypothetical protein
MSLVLKLLTVSLSQPSELKYLSYHSVIGQQNLAVEVSMQRNTTMLPLTGEATRQLEPKDQ